VVDLEWNRKTIFEKLDWLKETLEKLIEAANRNMSVHQELSPPMGAAPTPARPPTPTSRPLPSRRRTEFQEFFRSP
jgi:hypothetical protein